MKTNTIQISVKQLDWCKRLQKTCDKIDDYVLPFNIEWIELFGSALRAKDHGETL